MQFGAQVSKKLEEHQNVGTGLPNHMVLHPTVIFTECNYLLVYICDHNITGYVQKWCHQTMLKDSPISTSYILIAA